MANSELQKAFNEAVSFVNGHTQPMPADVLLKLYAYFRIANKDYSNPGSKKPLINAFKANALIQAQNISIKEAMEEYIKLADELKKTL